MSPVRSQENKMETCVRIHYSCIVLLLFWGSACGGRVGPGDVGSGDVGSGDTGSGDTGSGDTGSGDTGSGDTGSGDTGSGDSCAPFCALRSCGSDGCGGSCGSCAGQCDAGGQCQPTSCSSGCTSGCPQGCFDFGDCTTTGGTLTTYANIYTAGVILTPQNAASTFDIFYRTALATTWWRGHSGTALPDGRVASSLFGLTPATSYEVRVVSGSAVSCAAFTSLELNPQYTVDKKLHVDASVAAGGNGTAGAPFQSIQAALDVSSAGTDIIVHAGIYHEALTMSISGEPGKYLRLLGGQAILDGADQNVVASGLNWTADGNNVWWATWSGDPRYLARNGARMYHYITLAGLRAGIGDDAESIAEGFFVDAGRLYVRSLSDPSGFTWQIPILNTAIALNANHNVWIEGFEIRFYGEGNYGKGIDVRGSNNVVVRNNHIHDMPSPVWIRRGSNRSRVEYNDIHQSMVPNWSWPAVKGTDHENTAIQVSGGTSAIVAFNSIWSIFNGIGSGDFDSPQDTTISFDVDVYGNRLRNTTDDGLEPEGACINNRYWGNVVDGPRNGVSLAPITWGPVWIIRNRFTDYLESGFKVSNNSNGPVFLYHNTCYTNRTGVNGMGVSGPFEGMTFRNNVVRGRKYALEMSRAALQNSLDYNNWYTPRGAPVIKWDNTRYDDLATWCTNTGLECNAQPLAPDLLGPTTGRFGLETNSPNINKALRMYGINDGYMGDGPDIGYLEQGQPEMKPLP